ncbi:MAG: hypothetical protein A2042_04035 [Candidatus Schekmanbacteria bacterium GWA2_38_11]|uniref:Radical SAM core domain-containing protein n=1 Tax=Candidatus Schekmanbacteria bacterium GWA2_38_11 TaxID=1817876 RepID=A0A1F7RNE2_9BACT|nr:MAG: hypothetical protein A2042_04035 [Candidatus Schekmanbacteria bacterium GWA2_38_11]
MNNLQYKHIEINLGRACNNTCIFCISDNNGIINKRFIDFKTVQNEMIFFYNQGYRSLGFLGGEPTIYPKIIQIARSAKKMGYNRISLTSNGVKLSDKVFCEKLIMAGVSRFSISIHSHTKEIEDYLTGVPGSFTKKIKGIKNLIYLNKQHIIKDSVALNVVVNKKNYKALDDIVSFFLKLGIDDIRFNFIVPDGSALGRNDLTPTYQVAKPYFYKIINDNEKKYRINVTFGEVPFCIFKNLYEKSNSLFQKYIGGFHDPIVDVSYSKFMKLNNGDYASIQDRFNWKEKNAQSHKVRLKRCLGCFFLGDCGGVLKTYLTIHKDIKIFTNFV